MTFPTRRSYALLALAFVGFAVYASLVPFAFRPIGLDEAVARFTRIVWRLPVFSSFSRSDAVANLLLFVPIGFCLSGAFRLGARAWWSGPLTTLGVLALSLPLSFAVEFLQLFTAGRTSSSRDIAAQFVGALVGNVLWEAGGSDMTDWIRSARGTDTRRQRLERLLWAYAGAWVLLNLAPFDLTLDVGVLARKARTGGLLLPLFGRTRDTALDLGWEAFRMLAGAFPLGVLALLTGRANEGRRRIASALGVALGLVLVVEALQFFVVSRVADVTDIASGGLGAAAGVLAGARWTARPDRPARRARLGLPLALLGIWCVVLAAYHWMPYDFQWDPAEIRDKLAGLSLIPFAGYHRGPDLNSLDQLLLKLWLSVPVGVASAFLAPAPGARRRLWVAGWLVWTGVLFTSIEAGQLFLPTRIPDPSDVLVAMAGALVGLALTFWVLNPPARPPRHSDPSGDLS